MESTINFRAVGNEQIAQLAQELERQSKSRRDYIVRTSEIRAHADEDGMRLLLPSDMGPVSYNIGPVAHEQLSWRLDITGNYYRKMTSEAPELWVQNVNYWAERSKKNWLARTLDGRVRAIMSNQYRILDNTELFFTAFDEAKKAGAKIVAADLTERRFYMKILHPEFMERIPAIQKAVQHRREARQLQGHTIYQGFEGLDEEDTEVIVPGLALSNSETGDGSMRAELFFYALICSNGLIGERSVSKMHLGGRIDEAWLSSETRQLQDATVWSEVRDVIRSAFDADVFKTYVDKMRGASEEQLGDPIRAVEVVAKNNGFSDDDKQRMLNELMVGGDTSVLGLINAVTALGRDKPNYDDGYKYEQLGGKLLNDHADLVAVARAPRAPRPSRSRKAQEPAAV